MRNYWIDWLAEKIAEGANSIETGEKRHESIEKSFRSFTRESLRLWDIPAFQQEVSDRNEDAWLGCRVAPFAGHYNEKPHLALSAAHAPAFDCPEAHADESIVQCGKEVLTDHSVIYLDLAERLYMMNGGVFQVRALFAWQDGEHFRFCVILTRPGTNKGWCLAWREGHHARSTVDRRFDNVWAMNSRMIADRSRPINFNKIDYGQFADIEKLVWITLASWTTVTDNAVPPMPQPPLDCQALMMPEAFIADDVVREEPFSLFRVVRLPAIDELRIGQVRHRLSAAKHNNRRHEVKRHMRRQAYGPKLSLRREIWIEAHQRGQGMPKVVMNTLPAGNQLAF